jgi:hypothetical protein
LVDLERRGFGNIGAELGAELVDVVGKEGSFKAGAGDGDVTKAGVEQVRMDACAGVDQDALCCESLRTVAGDRVAVVEVAILLGVEFDLAVVVEAGRNPAIGCDGFLTGSRVIVPPCRGG